MEYLTLVFLHVLFAIIWAGTVISLGFFIVPSVLDAGPGGGAVMAGTVQRRMPIVLTVAALTVVLTGLRLYSVRFSTAWLTSPEGIVLTLGALFGLSAFGLGMFVQRPTFQKMGELGAKLAAAGGPPDSAMLAEMQALRARARRLASIVAWELLAAAVLMASHRLAASF